MHIYLQWKLHQKSYIRCLSVLTRLTIHTSFRFIGCVSWTYCCLSHTVVGSSIENRVHWVCHPRSPTVSVPLSLSAQQSPSLLPIRPLWSLFIHRILPYSIVTAFRTIFLQSFGYWTACISSFYVGDDWFVWKHCSRSAAAAAGMMERRCVSEQGG